MVVLSCRFIIKCAQDRAPCTAQFVCEGFDHGNISSAILPPPLIQEQQLSVVVEKCALDTGNLLTVGFQNSVARITDHEFTFFTDK